MRYCVTLNGITKYSGTAEKCIEYILLEAPQTDHGHYEIIPWIDWKLVVTKTDGKEAEISPENLSLDEHLLLYKLTKMLDIDLLKIQLTKE